MQEMVSQLLDRTEHQYFGKYRGVVVSNRDPLQLGRLKVRVPSVLMDDPSTPDSNESVTDWAYPCVPCGGASEQGFFFIPDEGSQVWVEFEEGNLDHPIWVGTFWARPNQTNQVPTRAQDMAGTTDNLQPQRRVLKTSSGHVLEFCDIQGKETINLQHKDGALVNLDEKGSVAIFNKNGSFLFLNADAGEASLIDEKGNNISMTDSGITVTNKDGAIVDLSGEAVQVIAKNVHVRSQTVALGEGAVEPAILGKAFAQIFDTHTHPVTAPGAPTGPPIPTGMPLSSPLSPAISKWVTVK